MRQEQRVRFSHPLRTVALGEPNGLPTGSHTVGLPGTQSSVEVAALREINEQRQRQEERSAIERAVAGMGEAAKDLLARRQELLHEMQQVAVELAVAVASRITYDKLQTDKFAVEALVREVVDRLDAAGPVQVRMHSEDMSLLNRRLGEIQNVFAQTDVQFIPDDSLKRGDCVAEAGDLSVLSELEARLDGIRQHLLRNLTHAEIERRKAMPGDRELRRFPDRRQTA